MDEVFDGEKRSVVKKRVKREVGVGVDEITADKKVSVALRSLTDSGEEG